jgi:hypothetical protein
VDEVAITGLGMMSSIGSDLAKACAALRAGLVRAAATEVDVVVDDDEPDAIPVMGHPGRAHVAGRAVCARAGGGAAAPTRVSA